MFAFCFANVDRVAKSPLDGVLFSTMLPRLSDNHSITVSLSGVGVKIILGGLLSE